MSVHVYHFPLLNHIRHGERINFRFYLLSSLKRSIEKGTSPPLHQGLMLTLYKYSLALNPHGRCVLISTKSNSPMANVSNPSTPRS